MYCSHQGIVCSHDVHCPQASQGLLRAYHDFYRKGVSGAWSPSKNSKVCSRHFVGNVKGEDTREANYIPTIFIVVSSKTAEKCNRYIEAVRFFRTYCCFLTLLLWCRLLKMKQNAKSNLIEQSLRKVNDRRWMYTVATVLHDASICT